MGRTPCCDKKGLKKGPWTSEEDDILVNYIKNNNGHGSWRSLPKLAGLLRCGKSCRLRWTNYLRPDIKRGPFTPEEEKLIIQLHGMLGNRWAAIASQLAGRTDNEIKNLWNTHLKKRLLCMELDPLTHEPFPSHHHYPPSSTSSLSPASPATRHMAQWERARLEAEARLSCESSLLGPPPYAMPDPDFFLRLWNSEVGDSFRNLGKAGGGDDLAGTSPASPSSSSKCGSASALTTEGEAEPPTAEVAARPEGTSSDDMEEDSSDSALQLLLDFPINNDMSFLDRTGMLSDNSFICPSLTS